MAWTHETVYQALIDRGERVKPSAADRYVTLYSQDTNCAILYAPDSSAANEPLHTNAARADWSQEVFDRLKRAVEWARRENKGPGKDAQNFDHFRVVNWDDFASAIGLLPTSEREQALGAPANHQTSG
jgi:hypothetical protein